MNRHPAPHPGLERLQAFADGALDDREQSAVEGHVAGCARCAAEVEAWATLFREIGELPRLVPHEGFAERVLTGIEPPRERLPLAARVREVLTRRGLDRERRRHLSPERLQRYAEGHLSTRGIRRVDRHLAACRGCEREAGEWTALLARLGRLGRFDPSPSFADAVMARVRMPSAVAVRDRVPNPFGAAVRALLPRTRQAWAALSGVAVTPAVTLGLMIYTLFTHPTVTPGALASFAWWKVSELLDAAWNVGTAGIPGLGRVTALSDAARALTAAPSLLVGGFALFSLATVAALWVLYTNLIATQPVDGSYAHAST